MMSLEDCLASANECDAPMVSICGGEPLIYPKIEELIAGILEQGRIVYVCTNGMFMRKKMKDYLAAVYSPEIESKVAKLISEKLISEKVVFDLRNLNFVGSLGLKDFVATMEDMKKSSRPGVKFCGVSSEFRRLFEASGIHAQDMFESQEKALQAFVLSI